MLKVVGAMMGKTAASLSDLASGPPAERRISTAPRRCFSSRANRKQSPRSARDGNGHEAAHRCRAVMGAQQVTVTQPKRPSASWSLYNRIGRRWGERHPSPCRGALNSLSLDPARPGQIRRGGGRRRERPRHRASGARGAIHLSRSRSTLMKSQLFLYSGTKPADSGRAAALGRACGLPARATNPSPIAAASFLKTTGASERTGARENLAHRVGALQRARDGCSSRPAAAVPRSVVLPARS